VEGFDYNETFTRVAKMTSVCYIIFVAVSKGWELHQLDVNNAFLHGDLDEVLCMTLPLRYMCNIPHKVCRLQKLLYGLRQAPRQLFAKLFYKLRMDLCSYVDYFLFTYRKEGIFMVVLAGNDTHSCGEFKNDLNSYFSIKGLHPLKCFLGIEVARGPKGVVSRSAQVWP